MSPPDGVIGKPVVAESQVTQSGLVAGVPLFFHKVRKSAASPDTPEKVVLAASKTPVATVPIVIDARSVVATTVTAFTSS